MKAASVRRVSEILSPVCIDAMVLSFTWCNMPYTNTATTPDPNHSIRICTQQYPLARYVVPQIFVLIHPLLTSFFSRYLAIFLTPLPSYTILIYKHTREEEGVEWSGERQPRGCLAEDCGICLSHIRVSSLTHHVVHLVPKVRAAARVVARHVRQGGVALPLLGRIA